jgi:hypothetical protein
VSMKVIIWDLPDLMALCPGLALQAWQQQPLPHSMTLLYTHPSSLWLTWHNWLGPRNTSVMNPLAQVSLLHWLEFLLSRTVSKLHWLPQCCPSNHMLQSSLLTPHYWYFSQPTLFPI